MAHAALIASLILFSGFSYAQPNYDALKKALKENKTFTEKEFSTLKTCVAEADKIVSSESIGGISLSTGPKEVAKISGCKLEKSGIGRLDGNADVTWNFADCGLRVEHNEKEIHAIAIEKSSKLKLKSGVGIGDSLEAVKAKYKSLTQAENEEGISLSPKSCAIPTDCLFDYANLIISFDKKSKKVTGIQINDFTNAFCQYD